MNSLHTFNNFSRSLKPSDYTMPVFFIGHGSPMNGIEDNTFSQSWKALARQIPRPSAVLVVSAHWLSRGTRITAMEHPKTIHDFGGFPQALFDVQYPAPGNIDLANHTREIISSTDVGLDHDWGLDHGTWTVVRHIFPDADIPVLQLSIDYHKPADYHYALARQLASLRNKGVLILASGNMIHNLRMIAWDKLADNNYGYDWAVEFNEKLKSAIVNHDHRTLIDYQKIGEAAKLAVPTPDHYYPLIYALALHDGNEEVSLFNDKLVGGSLNMTSVKFG